VTTRNSHDWSAFYAQVNAAALARYPELLYRWFPAGRVVGREFTCGSLNGDVGKSFKVNIDTGVWCDFASGEPGGSDPISLYNCDSSSWPRRGRDGARTGAGDTTPEVEKDAR
jgi:hypothetical protein